MGLPTLAAVDAYFLSTNQHATTAQRAANCRFGKQRVAVRCVAVALTGTGRARSDRSAAWSQIMRQTHTFALYTCQCCSLALCVLLFMYSSRHTRAYARTRGLNYSECRQFPGCSRRAVHASDDKQHHDTARPEQRTRTRTRTTHTRSVVAVTASLPAATAACASRRRYALFK